MSTNDEHTYRVQGMTCGHCEMSVREAVEALDGVDSAAADRTSGELFVRGSADQDRVRAAIAEAGYSLAP